MVSTPRRHHQIEVERPPHFKPIYSAEMIQDRVNDMGRDISSWTAEVWNRSHTDVIAIPVLRGAIFFFADLVRQIGNSLDIAPVRASAYDATLNVRKEDSVALAVEDLHVHGRSVLVIDDICDSGATFSTLTDTLKKLGVLEVKTAVLIHRQKVKGNDFKPDWVGFAYDGPEWFVGYGMDDSDRFRNLPDVHIIQQNS